MTKKARATLLSPDQWASLPDSELLKLRFCDLGLKIEGSEVASKVDALHQELEARGLKFKPRLYFGDEWFSPEGMNAIAIPFFLAHPRLKQLEKSLMMEVEGGDPATFMKLLRHEAGHCFDHNYRFSRRKKWRDLFGPPTVDYHPETYRPRPYSRSFVTNLDNWYAQAHPDEDFAETFAVWLSPDVDWRKEYGDWPVAMSKLEYLDSLAHESARLKSQAVGGRLPCSVDHLTTTLEKHYARRKRENAQDYPDFYDGDLKSIFDGSQELSKREYGAGRFMHRHRKQIVSSVARWTGERKFTVDSLVKKLTLRCEELGLRVGKSETETTLEIAGFLATLVTHYLFTGKFKRSV